MSPVSRAVLGAPQVTGAVRRGTLAMTLVVRDEEDILETNLRYHLAQGVDFIYALDHNSVDATPDILRSFEQMGVLRMLREGGEVHDQARRVTRLARLAHDELGADWVINNDADEFWWPAVGDLKDLLCAIPQPFDVLVARRHDFIPRPEGPPALVAGVPFHDRMLWRHAESRTPSGQRLEPKAAHRGDARIVVAPGNHDVQAPALRRAPALPLVEVLHYPARDYEQFVRKTLHTGRGYELLAGRDPTTGIDQLLLLDLYRRGELRDYFDRWAVPDEELEAGVCAGRVVRDVRLRDYLAGTAAARPAHDPQQVRDVVAGALGLSAELSVARADAELLRLEMAEQTRQADAALAAASDARAVEQAAAHAAIVERHREVARLHDALEQVRNSRLMRSTRALRRVYYKLK